MGLTRKKESTHYYDGYERSLCSECKGPADIVMIGYSTDDANVLVCANHAEQLARKLLEDICDLNGARHG